MKVRSVECGVRSGKAHNAFTMIEIAISLAVIGFALVAIVGVLPTGMNVQKENREETIITQDATMFLNAIRNGERGLDDLTNYVIAITNHVVRYNTNGTVANEWNNWYTYTNSSTTPTYGITNGMRIIGLLSAPKYIWENATGPNPTLLSNRVSALVRSISGPASEKFPQTNDTVQELSLTYRMLVDVEPNSGTNYFSSISTNFQDTAITNNAAEVAYRKNNYGQARSYETNSFNLRLIFRWPILPNGNIGNGRQVVRTFVCSPQSPLVEPGYPNQLDFCLFFFQPSTLARIPIP